MCSHCNRPTCLSYRPHRIRAAITSVSSDRPPAAAGTFPGNGFTRASAIMPTCVDVMATSVNSTAAGTWGSSIGKAPGRLPGLGPACTPTKRSVFFSTARMRIAGECCRGGCCCRGRGGRGGRVAILAFVLRLAASRPRDHSATDMALTRSISLFPPRLAVPRRRAGGRQAPQRGATTTRTAKTSTATDRTTGTIRCDHGDCTTPTSHGRNGAHSH